MTEKSHVPRWTSATWSSLADASVKSAGSQPLADVLATGPGGMTMPAAGTSSPVTSPLPENVIVANWSFSTYVTSFGESCSNSGGAVSSKNGNSSSCTEVLKYSVASSCAFT